MAAEEETAWNVAEPPGEWNEIRIDTHETTWSSVDVSPDGTTLLFDMLGNLYTVPIAGGQASELTSGISWDMQPRFSPDGSKVVFVSDRGGADNLWIMNSDGSDPRAVTSEKEHLVHNPAWSPDGRFIVAKKGFTNTRSIPAGEIWLFHVGGGAGIQLQERPNGPIDQKNMAGPVYSPDGKSIYFSQDTTPGVLWQYNKDATGQVFVIQRYELATGETEVFAGGPGGAVRPTPSPDGTRLAFLKRLPGLVDAIYVKDLESGLETPVFKNFERDHQETSGSVGNAPAFAWTPDSRDLVFWTAGTFHRVSTETGETSDIPVHVQTTRKIRPALRFPVEVAPEEFPVRMLRWTQRSPVDEDLVLFQALGYLWTRDGDSPPSPRHRAERPLRVPPRLLARRPIDRLHHLGRSGSGKRSRRSHQRRSLPSPDAAAGALHRARLLPRRQQRRLPQDRVRWLSLRTGPLRSGDLSRAPSGGR